MRNLGRWLLLLGGTMSLSCREPTQIELRLFGSLDCKATTAGSPVFDSVLIVASPSISGDIAQLVPNALQTGCAEPPNVGSLVLVPAEDRNGSLVEVLVIAGVDANDATLSGTERKMTAEQCQDLLAKQGQLKGAPCIVARRKLGFIEGVPLVLPVQLDAACIGFDCEAERTCFEGTCVPVEVSCDQKTRSCEPDPIGSGGGGAGPGGGGAGPGGGGAGPGGGGAGPGGGGAGPGGGGASGGGGDGGVGPGGAGVGGAGGMCTQAGQPCNYAQGQDTNGECVETPNGLVCRSECTDAIQCNMKCFGSGVCWQGRCNCQPMCGLQYPTVPDEGECTLDCLQLDCGPDCIPSGCNDFNGEFACACGGAPPN